MIWYIIALLHANFSGVPDNQTALISIHQNQVYNLSHLSDFKEIYRNTAFANYVFLTRSPVGHIGGFTSCVMPVSVGFPQSLHHHRAIATWTIDEGNFLFPSSVSHGAEVDDAGNFTSMMTYYTLSSINLHDIKFTKSVNHIGDFKRVSQLRLPKICSICPIAKLFSHTGDTYDYSYSRNGVTERFILRQNGKLRYSSLSRILSDNHALQHNGSHTLQMNCCGPFNIITINDRCYFLFANGAVTPVYINQQSLQFPLCSMQMSVATSITHLATKDLTVNHHSRFRCLLRDNDHNRIYLFFDRYYLDMSNNTIHNHSVNFDFSHNVFYRAFTANQCASLVRVKSTK